MLYLAKLSFFRPLYNSHILAERWRRKARRRENLQKAPPKLYQCPTIHSRPCGSKAGYGLVMILTMMVMMIPTKRIMSNIEMFLPHSISNRSTQVLEGGMDTHLRKDWIFVFLWLDFFFHLAAIVFLITIQQKDICLKTVLSKKSWTCLAE